MLLLIIRRSNHKMKFQTAIIATIGMLVSVTVAAPATTPLKPRTQVCSGWCGGGSCFWECPDNLTCNTSGGCI